MALARAVNAIFFLMTATYCLLSYSPFASQQFIKAHLVVWLTSFVVWHHLWFLVMLGITALTITSEPPRAPGRRVAWAYLAVSSVLAVVLLVRSILPEVENNGRGLVLALIALVPPLWLALVDHLATSSTFAPAPASDTRVVGACLVAGVVVWLEQAALLPWRLSQTGDITLTSGGIAFGLIASAVGHLAIFSLFAIAMLAVLRVARMPVLSRTVGGAAGTIEYWLLAALSAFVITLIADRLVFAAIAFTGPVGWLVAIALATTMTLVWSGMARRRGPDVSGSPATALDVWLAPLPGVSSRGISVAALAAMAAVGFVVINRVAALDWDFVIQKLAVVVLWCLAFAYSYGAIGGASRRPAWRLIAAPLTALAVFAGWIAAEPHVAHWTGHETFVPEFVLEGFVAADPSLRLISGLLHVDSPGDAAFYAYLRANTVIQHADLSPVDVDFAKPIGPAREPRPHIFLFVVDSMRRDYLSTYNPAVRFTPAIARFASDSVVFERAFTRYGGTALSVPAIWAGGMLIHKQYVKPFGPMNTLLKLLDADGYRRFMSMDVIVNELLPRDAGLVELDRGLPEFKFDLCRTLVDLRGRLDADAGDSHPVFAYTLSQNIHISHVRSQLVPAGKTYPGFEPHVASQIERMDGCFGSFIDFLRQTGRYDNSIVVLTSDHGDSLGEGLRWGHSYTMFPEIVRIPLIVHIPPRLRERFHADPETIGFSIDLTPSLYRLLGHAPSDLGPLFGVPLFVGTAGSEEPVEIDESDRRHRPYMAVSSYGAVYALISDNGTKLYVADGVNSRDYAYDLSGLSPVRIGILARDREADRAEIKRRIAELAHLYRFSSAQ